jgi:hypothetical protein
MTKKPNLLIYDDLIEPIKDALEELQEIKEHYNKKSAATAFIDKGIFAYIIALFEAQLMNVRSDICSPFLKSYLKSS